MTPTAVSLAVAALLLTPGPTNTLLAVAGAERGTARALRLIPVELAGYLATVVPLTLLGAGLLATYPAVKPVITLVAAGWVMWLALTMWRLPKQGIDAAPVITARTLLATTLVNPKALIFGLVLLPSPTGVWLNIGIFATEVVVIAAMWVTLGTALSRTGPTGHRGLPDWLRRVAAIWLAFLSLSLAAQALSARESGGAHAPVELHLLDAEPPE